ncbi:hypothetical protein BBP40_009477 [Aspergillus hancockii]|uniref:Nonribosomal peptide synthetase hkm11 n=1 Tax=Aspergillus hancockii TaxID=1873369 RepID=HKM11_ASPHA|nr:RecName: Full=Nonribosomal peptide synthetase hkm11; AltName: Full=Hancockiamides biosynthesis cluster protein 11 [Aspergillus hancockii]KAF7597139.1 hypothetical protein BBP40_009477 [Aspergillus hancockii]
MTVPATTKDPRDSLLDSPLVHFPSLPRDSYLPHPTEHTVVSIDDEEILPSTRSSLHDVLQVAWSLVLADQTSSPEVVFGMAYDGRTTDDGEQAIMPFRLRLRAEDSVQEALAAAAAVTLQMRQWEHMGLRRFSTMSPQNVVLCQFRNLFVIDHKDPTEDCVERSCTSYSKGYALTVLCEIVDQVIHVHAMFDPLVLPPGQLRLILHQFGDILKTCLRGPPGRVKDLQQIGPDGLNYIYEWNRGGERDEGIVCVHQLIEDRFKQAPFAAAVCAWDGALTYGELDRWAKRIAAQLVEAGVKPGSFVGIYMQKSVLAVVAMVAIVKAGAAFIFLPPFLPTVRLQLMCQRTPVELVLSVATLLRSASDLSVPVQVLDYRAKDEEETAATSGGSEIAQPNHPLYAIFTSGSTGEPKGVVVDRASFGPGVREYCRRAQLGPNSRLFQSVSYAFIVSIFEQLISLALGACICVPSEEQLQNDMEGAMCRYQATWGCMTPSVARTLKPERLSCLKTLALTGEPVNQSDMEQWKDHVNLYTLYGQSETGSTLLINSITGSLADSRGLGRPSTGACWIVDPEDPTTLRPLGAEGELLIETTALARGYMNNLEESARTFIEMPKWLKQLRPQGHRSRCLLTGDIVRYYDTDGTIRLLSRKGTGAKIRGQRVELGEIEHHLRPKFPDARHILVDVVCPAKAGTGHSILVAFVHGPWKDTEKTGELATATSEFRQQARRVIAELRQVLPSFMVPSAIVPLADVPTTATGKVHRKSLRERMSALTVAEILAYNQEDRSAYRAPTTEQEALLLSICAELLYLPASSISLDNSFFQVGGDSLNARQLAAKVRSHGFSLLATDIFEASTLASLASRMRQYNQTDSEVSTAPEGDPFEGLKQELLGELPSSLVKENVEDVYPASDMQARAIRTHMLDYFPFEIKGQLDRHQLQHACETLIRRTPVMRSVFINFRGKMLQVTLRSVAIPYKELTIPTGEDPLSWARLHIAEDKKKTAAFDRPTIRFTLCRQSLQHHIFIVRLPHAIYDGSCLEQVAKQISAAYNAQTLPEAPDFAAYARRCARLRTPSAMDFWRNFLAESEVTRLPHASKGDEVAVIYPGECSPRSPPPGITMATAIKAAWAWVLHKRTGKLDVLFGQVGSTRGIDIPGATDIIGLCLNITAVRVQFAGLQTVEDLLRMLQQQHMRALMYETADWTDIVANASSWPEGTELDSVVLHENFGGLPALDLGDAIGEMADPIFSLSTSNPLTLVTWPSTQTLTSFLLTRENVFQKEYAEGLVTEFNQTLVQFLDFPESSLCSISTCG